MNLWVKTLRQLTILSVALFFFSCEDESSLLGFKNPTSKFNVRYIDIPLHTEESESYVLAIDSLITDLRPNVSSSGQAQFVDGLIVGQYQDPEFGGLSAQPYLGLYALSNTALNATAEFDSITVRVRLNFYGYGFSDKKQYRFGVHEITGDTLSLYNGRRYYASSAAPDYGLEPLGEVTTTVHYDSLRKKSSGESTQDTLYLRGRLADDYGRRIFDLMKVGFNTDELQKAFKNQVRGITLLPDAAEPGLLGMNVVNTFGQLSRIEVHYHTLTDEGDVKDTLSAAVGFEYASFTKIDADRIGTELASASPYEAFIPISDKRYIQSGAGIVTKFDLAPFYKFADTVENIVVNSAELVIDNVTGSAGMDPHSALLLRLMNSSSNQFLNSRMPADREVAQRYYVTSSTTDPYYFPVVETGSPAAMTYSGGDNRYSGFVTLFTQSLIANKNDANGINENRLRYVALVPASPPANRGVTRTLFNKDNVRLRIFYTTANTVEP